MFDETEALAIKDEMEQNGILDTYSILSS